MGYIMWLVLVIFSPISAWPAPQNIYYFYLARRTVWLLIIYNAHNAVYRVDGQFAESDDRIHTHEVEMSCLRK